MCQRAMLAIVLCTSPTLLLADEPTSALDATVQLEVLELLARLNREEGLAIVLVTHEIGVALRYADRLHVVADGCTVESGTPDELRSRTEVHPATRALLAAAAALNPVRDGEVRDEEKRDGKIRDGENDRG
jgi:ABC-type glutathione transport system ATPase component